LSNRPYLIGEMYRVVENPNQDDKEHYALEIIKGEYEGTVYQYGKVEFVEGKPELNFQRTIRRVPEGMELSNLESSADLNNLMGDILVELLEEQVKRQEKE
tara:strand:+ start:91 stop:393 length:303 start_codon:yes stop_codon:yes gene_type:complete